MNEKIIQGNPYYLNNPNLPTIHASFEWTPEMITQLKKAEKDIIYFAENFFYIVNLDNGKQIIKLYKAQKRILKSLQKYNKVVVLSSRQAGKTTLMTIYALWVACFNNDKNILIVANKEKTAKQILERIRLAYELLPNWLKPAVEDYSKTLIRFVNGSKIDISTTSSSASRGSSVNVLILDEAAHIQEHLMEEFFKSVIPTISSSKNSKIFMVSTPKGQANFFYKIYSGAEKGENGWKHERIDWWEVPGRDEKWKQDTINALGSLDAFEQEFGNSFLKTGEGVVDEYILRDLKDNCTKPSILNTSVYKIWEEPKKGNIYVFGVDTAEGVGRNYSVVQVLDITDLTNIKQVAVFADNKIDTFYFAEKIYNMAHEWGMPYIVIERNNQGAQVLQVLNHVYHYEYIVDYKNEKGGIYDKGGIYSSTNTKYEAIINARYWINSLNVVKLNDIYTVHEIETFEKKENGTWSARLGENIYDDRVMALFWALFILMPTIVEKYYEVYEYDQRGKPLKIKRNDYIEENLYKFNNNKNNLDTNDFYSPILFSGVDYNSIDNLDEFKNFWNIF